MWYTVVDDNVEAAPIYRCDGKAGQPIVRPHENHDLHIVCKPTWMDSWQKQQISSRAALQFWIEELDLQTLRTTTERVYTAFFYSGTVQHLWQVEEEVLFGHFMTTLNDAFEQACASEDIGYKSGSESMNVPTPLCQAPWPYHVSMQKTYLSGMPFQEHSHPPATPMQCITDWLVNRTIQ